MAIPNKSISFKEPEEPAFLKAFKARVGYKEEATVDTKREEPPQSKNFDEREDREDELPTVVVLKQGDVSEEDYKLFLKQDTKRMESTDTKFFSEDSNCNSRAKQFDTGAAVTGEAGDKIVFKRPVKRRSSESGRIEASSSSPTSGGRKKQKVEKEKKSPKTVKTAVKNSCLLSFDEDDDDS